MGSRTRALRRIADIDIRNEIHDLVETAVRSRYTSVTNKCEAGNILAATLLRGWTLVLTVSEHDDIDHYHLSTMAPRGRAVTPVDLDNFERFFDALQRETDSDGEPEDLTPNDAEESSIHHWAWHDDGSPVEPIVPAGFAQFHAHEEALRHGARPFHHHHRKRRQA